MPRITFTAFLISISILGQSTKLPPVINICIAHCLVLTLENGQYVHADSQNSSVYTVESFTRDSFVLHRTDRGSFPLTATLTGKPSPDGNSIPSGTILWTSGNSGQGAFKAAWGAAIKTVPASDAERDIQAVIACGPSSSAPAAEAYLHGMEAMSAGRPDIGTCWMHVAAKQGNANAQGVLAAMLYRGIGVPADHAEALTWAQKAAAQNNSVGELSLALMYANGDGVPKDPGKAEYWKTKSEKDRIAAQVQTRPLTMQDLGALLDKKSPSGLTGREALQLGLGLVNGVIGDIDEQGRRADCVASRQTCK